MNHQDSYSPSTRLDVLQSRFATQVVARLSEKAELTPHDVCERLRFAREKAIQRSRAVLVPLQSPAAVSGNGGLGALSLHPGSSGANWWVRFGSVLPLAALLLGLIFIQTSHTHSQISAAAEVDAALLGDDVPVSAYGDPGFVEFLKTARD